MMYRVAKFGMLVSTAALLAAAGSASAFAALPSAFGPEVKIGEPRNGFVGSMDVAPYHGKAGDSFTVTGTKLPPNQEFQLVWSTVDGRWKVDGENYKGREYQPASYQMARIKTDAAGKFTAKFVTPRTSDSATTSCCSRAIAWSTRLPIPST